MSRYQPESCRTNASQNGLALPHIVEAAGTTCSVPNAARISSARIADATRTASAPATICASVRADKRFRKAHRLGVGERLIELGERVGARADRAPGDGRVMLLEDA